MRLENEKLFSIVRAFLEANGVRINPATGWRFYKKGCKGIKLETVLVGGRRMTSVEAVHRFVAATTAAADGTPMKARTSRQREAAIAAAERELAEAGI